MADIRNSQRSASMGAIADALLSGKSGLNEYEIKKWMPFIGGTGLGDLFMGQAPELVDDISYYGPRAAFKGGNRVSGGLGTIQPKQETFDAAMLGLDAAGLASLFTMMGKGSINLARHGLYNNKVNRLVSTTNQELDDAYNWSISQGANFPTEAEGKAWIKDLLYRSKRADLEEKHDLPVDKVSEMLKNLTQEQFQKERGYSKKAIDNWNSYLSTVEKGKNYNLDMDTIAGLEYNPTAPNYNELYKSGQHPLYNKSLNSLSISEVAKLSKSALNKMAMEAGNLSRRKFLKGSAAVAGGAALGGLLKLGKEAGEQVAKHSTDNVAAKVAKKYKYNSLREYNDYLNKIEAQAIKDNQGPRMKRFFAEQDEYTYNLYKDIKKQIDNGGAGALDYYDDALYRMHGEDTINAFSPQAKAEMKEFKNLYRSGHLQLGGDNYYDNISWPDMLDDWVTYDDVPF